ncbi:hypothetical protein H6F44_13900 [Pseudanabaena sp. FACHB-1277]|jgi:hypothetical protein|uniref:Uncharacterized protein n=1 Tax=Pseudanabaena cinerea FACHB-1277 TaxID=2949581 RepID=A0A926Z6X8_9CYAN|nr:hypothetical protein [Pseudanabaena cinerea]MBD2151205.1 hypothetical protein [Pseudanabaena cinerea FACHB-1277]
MRLLLQILGFLVGLAICLWVHYIAGFMGGNPSSVMKLNPGLTGSFYAVLLLYAGGLGFVFIRSILFGGDDYSLKSGFFSGLVGGYYLPPAFYAYALFLVFSIALGAPVPPTVILFIFK